MLVKAGLAALVVAGVNLVAVTPAHTQVTEVATGVLCGFASESDPTIEGDVRTGEMDGGPLAATSPGATIDLRCTIQVGAANSAHSGSDSVSASSGPMLQVATVRPVLLQFDSPAGQPVYLCTQATIDGLTYYYDDLTGRWSRSSEVACSETTHQEILDEEGPVGVGFVTMQSTDGVAVQVTSSSNLSCGGYDGRGVSCSVKAGARKCTTVSVEASHVPNLVATVTGTADCGNLSTTATAGPMTSSAANTAAGHGNQALDCQMTVTGVPILPRVTCSYQYAA